MNRLEKYQRENLENLAHDKAELYREQAELKNEIIEDEFCEELLEVYMGSDEFKKISDSNLKMIVMAMREYAEKH